MTATDATEETVAAAAKRLRAATISGIPCPPVRDLIGPDDADLAYAVQQRLAAARRAEGRRVVGHKIGLTSVAVQRQLGVDRPDFGLLFDDMDATGAPIRIDRLLQPRIEAEVAFVLAADVLDPEVDAAGVAAAVKHAVPALEIVDSRIAGWDITLADTVADNASSGLFVLGAQRRTLDGFAPVDVRMTMTRNGEPVSSGTGADCLGNPLAALAWLARTAIANGDPLRSGHIVLSGALGPMVAVRPGDTFRADVSGLGAVEATFTHAGAS